MDAMKPRTSDSMDLKLSEPPDNTVAEAYCATVISNLEGWKGMIFPSTKEGRNPTIDQLESRVSHLEKLNFINSPPPMDTPSWDSLTWRVSRLHRRMPPGPGMNTLRAMPPHITPCMTLLQSTVASIHFMGALSWTTRIETDEELREVAQYLCYLAGERGYKTAGSYELKFNCLLALDLSLLADAQPMMPRPRPMMGPPRPRIISYSKPSCGCSHCSYHNARDRERGRDNRKGVKARIAGVFKKLAFWRRGRRYETDSDASSFTTRSSSTWN